MPQEVPRMEYRLEVIDGYMRPIFEGKEPEWNELMWELLVPFPSSGAVLLEELERVESGELEKWLFEGPGAKITCAQKTLLVEEILKDGETRESIKIELPLREAVLLLWKWVFECVWREQYGIEQITSK